MLSSTAERQLYVVAGDAEPDAAYVVADITQDWLYRNPIGGMSMIVWTGIRDVTASYWRMGGDTGRVAQAVSYANSHLINEFGTVWKRRVITSSPAGQR